MSKTKFLKKEIIKLLKNPPKYFEWMVGIDSIEYTLEGDEYIVSQNNNSTYHEVPLTTIFREENKDKNFIKAIRYYAKKEQFEDEMKDILNE